ncbi:MAG: DUF2489 domain-containing protein [Porticoccaceae bacterium]
MKTLVAVVAVLIVLVLASYAAWLLYRLWKLGRATRRVTAASPSQAKGVSQVGAGKGIYLIADAMLDNKMTHTEACLRIAALAGGLENVETFRREYGVLFRVAEATGHIPILDEWRALSHEEKARYDRERKDIEQKYADAVVDAAQRIKVMLSGVL